MDSSTVPGTMSRLQTVRGGQEADIRKLVDRIYTFYEDRFSPSEAREFGRAQDPAIRDPLVEQDDQLLPVAVRRPEDEGAGHRQERQQVRAALPGRRQPRPLPHLQQVGAP